MNPIEYSNNVANAQEAHEAIRPTDPKKSPESIENNIGKDEYELYSLIWKRTLSSQMRKWEGLRTSIIITNESNEIRFRASGTVTTFEGFRALYEEGRKDVKEDSQDLPKLEKGNHLNLIEI